MDQVDMINDEEQSPLHIKRELDIDIPYRVAFPTCLKQQQNDTNKTIEHLEIDEALIQAETTPKTQIDISSPRLPFLTHSQIMGMNQDEDELPINKSSLRYPLSAIPEELTPSNIPDQSKVSNQDVIIDNISLVNSQQLKFSKKSSETNKDVLSHINMDVSKFKEELKEQIILLETKIQELEKENFILKKKSNQEKVKYIELQMETEYKITSLNEQFQDQEAHYQKQITIYKNDLNNAKQQINLYKQQILQHDNYIHQSTQSQIQLIYNHSIQQTHHQSNKQLSLSQSFNDQLCKQQKNQLLTQVQYDFVCSKLIKIISKIDQKIDSHNKDLFDLIQILEDRVQQFVNIEEEEKIDENRTLLSTLKMELGEIKSIRGQLSRIFQEHDSFIHKRNNDNQNDIRINELNLQILGIKQEKLELMELNQKQQNQINQQSQMIIQLQQKINNSIQTDTQRVQTQFIRQMQTISDVKSIKEQLKQKQESIKKTFRSQNSPQSRSENASPTLKFLNSPKNSNHASNYQKLQQNDKKQQFYNRTSDFSVDNNSIHQTNTQNINNSVHQSSEIIQKLIEQFRGDTNNKVQKKSGYIKKN
ncbi:unnamed protein product [Paramecium sonneborni]|uniref:Uncharacterized protein n=1 Tax=Paramecium sonneborni TaxID=65129 RepID=A0A8S1NQF8_9CILI|nr:unnamed protein product [Paramecium sonneborni]